MPPKIPHYAADGHTNICPNCGDPFHLYKLVCALCGKLRPSMFGEEPTLADLQAREKESSDGSTQ